MIILFFHTCTQLNKVNTFHHLYPNKRLSTVNSIKVFCYFLIFITCIKNIVFFKLTCPEMTV